MGLITISNIEDNTSASANTLNTRFGIIAREVNGNLDSANYKNKSVTVEKLADGILSVAYPLGSIYMNANSAINPATLLGFGTWISFGEGRVLVGKAATGTFATVGGTMGAETHALTGAENAAHNHTGTTSADGTHNHKFPIAVTSGTGAGGDIKGVNVPSNGNSNYNSSDAGNHAHSFTTTTSGSGTPHNNVQPSLVVHMWMRTV